MPLGSGCVTVCHADGRGERERLLPSRETFDKINRSCVHSRKLAEALREEAARRARVDAQ